MSYNRDFEQDSYLVLDADGYSMDIPMNGVSEVAIQCDITDLNGLLAGYMSIQESNTQVNWADTGTPVEVTGDDCLMFEYSGAAGYVRVKWNSDAGKGGATFNISKKS